MKTLVDLGPNECAFPIGDPPRGREAEQLFCAKPRPPGRKPYCPACCAIAYLPSTGEPLKVAIWIERLAA